MSNPKRELFEFSVTYDLTKNENGRITWEHGSAEVVAVDEEDVLKLFKEEYPEHTVELTKIVKGESVGFEEDEDW